MRKITTDRKINRMSITSVEKPLWRKSSMLMEAPIATKVAMPRRVPMMVANINEVKGSFKIPAA